MKFGIDNSCKGPRDLTSVAFLRWFVSFYSFFIAFFLFALVQKTNLEKMLWLTFCHAAMFKCKSAQHCTSDQPRADRHLVVGVQ